jgi:hypothetical protein
MESKIARLISYILHPLLMPTYALLLLFNQNTYYVLILPEKLKWALTGLIFGNTFILPTVIIWLMLQKGIISSLQLPERKERTFPFVIAAISFFATYFMLGNMGLPAVFLLFLLGGSILVVVAAIINLFWKISIHMMGIGGLAGGFAGLMFTHHLNAPLLIILLIILGGITGFARLKLNTHNEAQVYTGYVAGALIMSGTIILL